MTNIYKWKIELYLPDEWPPSKRYLVNAPSFDDAIRKAKAHYLQFVGNVRFGGCSGQVVQPGEDVSKWENVQ